MFEKRGEFLISIFQDFVNNVKLSYNNFANIFNKVWKEPYNYIVIDITKNKHINGELRINWDRRVFVVCIYTRWGLRPAVLTQRQSKTNTSPLRSIGLPCSSLV